MALTLTIANTRGGDRQTRTLGKGTLSIGRAPGNDWVLADPDQHLSRTHCMVAFEDGGHFITDLSTNGLFINGARSPTTRNDRIELTDGDTVQFGSYMMTVAEIPDALAERLAPVGFAAGSAPGGNPFADPGGGDASHPLDVDPLDDPLGRPVPAGFQHPLPPAPPPELRARDPFDVADEAFANSKRKSLDDSEDDLFRGLKPAAPWQGPAQGDAAPVSAHAFTPPRSLAPVNVDEIDFDALLGDLPPGPGGASGAAPQQPFAPAVAAPMPPPPVAVPAAPPPAAARQAPEQRVVPPASPRAAAAPEPAPVAAADGDVAQALLAAFLDGAGMGNLKLPAQDPQARMRAVGELFQALVAGTRDVLMSRAEIKHEMRAEQTMLRARDNNALKFSVSAEEAMAALLLPDRPGYKPALAAVEEAFNDIRAHELAVMVGLQATLQALLKRFDPAALETRLQPGMLDSILPAARKARFWELFCATYKDIANEARDDFDSILGREFARAYDAQVRKL
jgi:type VI secretion system FHA domain protein